MINVSSIFKKKASYFHTSPSYLSELFSPALSRFSSYVRKTSPLADDINSSNFDLLGDRNQNHYFPRFRSHNIRDKYADMIKSYTYSVHNTNNLETIELSNITETLSYEIYFAGSDQDATAQHSLVFRTHNLSDHPGFNAIPSRNFIFWNYPGTGANKDCDLSLCEAGYRQVHNLMTLKNISAEQITLHGKSLGGAVAIQVARRLYEEGHYVNLEVDRSFSRYSSVISKIIEKELIPYKLHLLMSSILIFSFYGAVLGILIAGWIARLKFTPTMILGSVLGGIIAVTGALAAALLGFVCGMILSLQYLWTSEPIPLMLEPACRTLLSAAACEMDSVSELKEIDKIISTHKQSSKIEIINVDDDEVIHRDSSLIYGLGKDAAFFENNQKFSLHSYSRGGHIYGVSQHNDNQLFQKI